MLERIAADAVLLVHLAFVVFVILGGALLLRWPKLAWIHLPAVMWAALVELNGWICPLTPLEVELRRASGDAGYAGDFLEHYIVALLYPEGLTRAMQIGFGAAVVAINVVVYTIVARRASASRRT
ncbi:MAG TPA: DUF2784 domain-containing protein [Casimicrobiaceae bacterium]|jgi:hypothetical protein|nr:DUF2784 domain-containing protein [Casimicrobiaceae bacterium]